MQVEDSVFEDYVKTSVSIAEVCRKLGIRPVGGNYKTVNYRISRLGLDTSHFTGQGHNKGRFGKHRSGGRTAKPLAEILVENSVYNSSKLRQRLISEGLKEAKCEGCGLSEWKGKPIPLELEHKNGVNTDNRIENLEILCPNCHAQTPFYRGRNKVSARAEMFDVEPLKFGEALTQEGDGNPELSPYGESVETLREEPKICENCGEEYRNRNSKFCSYKCKREAYNTKPKVPEILEAFREKKSYVQVGKHFGVSDNAVRKWVESYGIEDMVKRKSSAQT